MSASGNSDMRLNWRSTCSPTLSDHTQNSVGKLRTTELQQGFCLSCGLCLVGLRTSRMTQPSKATIIAAMLQPFHEIFHYVSSDVMLL